jgi:hypothetical protein
MADEIKINRILTTPGANRGSGICYTITRLISRLKSIPEITHFHPRNSTTATVIHEKIKSVNSAIVQEASAQYVCTVKMIDKYGYPISQKPISKHPRITKTGLSFITDTQKSKSNPNPKKVRIKICTY